MKKLLLLVPILLFFQFASAQIYANGVVVDSAKAEHFLLLKPVVKKSGKKEQFSFTIQCANCKEKEKWTNASGEILLIDSLPAAFDALYRQGWEYKDAIADTSGFSDGPVDTNVRFLFQRRK